MAKAKTLVGLDVHATKIAAAVLDAETGELQMFAMSGENATAAGFCAGFDHQDRLRARPAAAGRSGLALPRAPKHRQGAPADHTTTNQRKHVKIIVPPLTTGSPYQLASIIGEGY